MAKGLRRGLPALLLAVLALAALLVLARAGAAVLRCLLPVGAAFFFVAMASSS